MKKQNIYNTEIASDSYAKYEKTLNSFVKNPDKKTDTICYHIKKIVEDYLKTENNIEYLCSNEYEYILFFKDKSKIYSKREIELLFDNLFDKLDENKMFEDYSKKFIFINKDSYFLYRPSSYSVEKLDKHEVYLRFFEE